SFADVTSQPQVDVDVRVRTEPRKGHAATLADVAPARFERAISSGSRHEHQPSGRPPRFDSAAPSSDPSFPPRSRLCRVPAAAATQGDWNGLEALGPQQARGRGARSHVAKPLSVPLLRRPHPLEPGGPLPAPPAISPGGGYWPHSGIATPSAPAQGGATRGGASSGSLPSPCD